MADIIAKNLSGDEFVVIAQSELSEELNGNRTLSLVIAPTGVNKLFMNELSELWQIKYYGEDFTVVYVKKASKGHSFYTEVKAIPTSFDKLDSDRIYDKIEGRYSEEYLFGKVFSNTGYNVQIIGDFPDAEIKEFGEGKTKLELFKDLLELFKAEFYTQGKTFYIQSKVGRDMSFEYRYRLNATNVSHESDAASMYTYIKGFGDYDDSEEKGGMKNAKLKLEYESPLSRILGRRHAPMIADGKVTSRDKLLKSMKNAVDNSLKISVSADIRDLRQQNYPYAQPALGDRIFLNDTRIRFNEEVRVVQITTQRYANGKIRSINVIFGTEKLTRRYASKLSSMSKTLNDLIDGKIDIKYSNVDAKAREMLAHLQGVNSDVKIDNGVYAVDKDNPNNIVGLNSAGWYISKDGGRTTKVIATADGLTADAITSGTISADKIRGGHISADMIRGGSISADMIRGGSISADMIRGGSISADMLRGGSISADMIRGGHISADMIRGGTISSDLINLGPISLDKATGTISADKIRGGKISADMIEGGTLSSSSGSMSWDLNNNRLNYRDGATTDYYGSSSITFHDNSTSLHRTNNGTVAFINFYRTAGSEYPAAVIGTNGTTAIDSNTSSFSGLKAHTARASSDGYSQVNIIGDKIYFDSHGGDTDTGSWVLECYRKGSGAITRAFYGGYPTEYSYELGQRGFWFNTVWTNGINDGLRIVSYTDGAMGVTSWNKKYGIKLNSGGADIIFNGISYPIRSILKSAGYSV